MSSRLIDAMNQTARTANGAITNYSSMNSCVDLFFTIGAARNIDILPIFSKAYVEDAELALRILLWARDVRQGAGERQTFRNVLNYLADQGASEEMHVIKVLSAIPHLGRWDDLLNIIGSKYESFAFALIKAGLQQEQTQTLCAKWMPRKGKKAVAIRKALGMSPKEYRKTLVALSNTVEQKICAKEWQAVEYGKLPSVAAKKYQRTFSKHDGDRYGQYIEGLKKGTEKINAGAIFPHDIVKDMRRYDANKDLLEEQWSRLPNYLEGNKDNILPVVDVSGSMCVGIGPKGNTQAIDVSVALGMYISERAEGIFKDHFITFSEKPQLQQLKGRLRDRMAQLDMADWGMNTNFNAVFRVILEQAKLFNVPESEMPTKLLVLSDMEFDEAERGSGGTNYQEARALYEAAGYKLPQIVFWNLNARRGNVPVTVDDNGTALVSGFSPSILKSLLKEGTLDPVKVMMDAVMIDRYKL